MLYWQFSLCGVTVFAKRFCYREIRSPGFEFLHHEAGGAKWTLFPMQHWLPCCPLQVAHTSRPCFTSPLQFPASRPRFMSPLHVSTSCPSFTSLLHVPASHPCFTSLLHFPASLPHLTSCVTFLLHSPTLLPCFTSLLHFPTTYSSQGMKNLNSGLPFRQTALKFCLSQADLRTCLFYII